MRHSFLEPLGLATIPKGLQDAKRKLHRGHEVEQRSHLKPASQKVLGRSLHTHTHARVGMRMHVFACSFLVRNTTQVG